MIYSEIAYTLIVFKVNEFNIMTLDQLPLLLWIKLAIGLLIFLGPGFLTLQFSSFRKELDFSFILVAAFGLSLGEWTVLLGLTNLLGLRTLPAIVISLFLLCWAAGLLVQKPWQHSFKKSPPFKLDRIALWLILTIGLVISLWGIRNEVAGLGSDSYHHTLITQMIMDQGRLPQDYGSFLPIISFRYHYGFHALAAFLGWVSGIPTRLVVLILGPVLISLCAASVALLTEKMTDNRLAGLTAAIFVAFTCVFPTHFLNWGRYTQLTGLTALSVFLALFWIWMRNGYLIRETPLLALIAVGIGLSHYRVVTFGAVGAVVLVLAWGVGLYQWLDWKKIFTRGLVLVAFAMVAAAPWVIHLVATDQIGYPVPVAERSDFYFSLERLGDALVQYPTNLPSLIIAGVVALIGWFRRDRLIIALTSWFVIVLLPSRHIVLIDTISVVISAFIPIAIIMGIGLVYLCRLLDKVIHANFQHIIVISLLFILLLGGLAANLTSPIVNDGLLHPVDLPAMEFIRQETSTDAYFYVNMFHFPFSDTLIVGSDAGAWIPLLAQRRVSLPVLNYYIERLNDPTWVDRLCQLDQLNGDITSEAGLALLRAEGITHVYIGDRGGVIQPASLLSSPDFKLIYQDQTVYIFELIK